MKRHPINRVRYSLVAVALIASVFSWNSGCDRAAPQSTASQPAPRAPEPAPPAPAAATLSPLHADIVQQSEAAFDFASYLKPLDDLPAAAPRELAPLFGIRVLKDKEKLPPTRKPLAVHTDSASGDDATPTLYYKSDKDQVGKESFERMSFVWFINAKLDKTELKEGSDSAPLQYSAISLTLNKGGTPVIARVRQSCSPMDRFFVAESIESAARQEHGAPLAGRRFSVERAANSSSAGNQRDVLVPSLMATPPDKSGPWIYISDKDDFVTGVICRCSAAQIRAFTERLEYDLRPLSDVPASITLPDLADPTSASLRLPTTIP